MGRGSSLTPDVVTTATSRSGREHILAALRDAAAWLRPGTAVQTELAFALACLTLERAAAHHGVARVLTETDEPLVRAFNCARSSLTKLTVLAPADADYGQLFRELNAALADYVFEPAAGT